MFLNHVLKGHFGLQLDPQILLVHVTPSKYHIASLCPHLYDIFCATGFYHHFRRLTVSTDYLNPNLAYFRPPNIFLSSGPKAHTTNHVLFGGKMLRWTRSIGGPGGHPNLPANLGGSAPRTPRTELLQIWEHMTPYMSHIMAIEHILWP